MTRGSPDLFFNKLLLDGYRPLRSTYFSSVPNLNLLMMPPTPSNRNLHNSFHPGLDETDLPKPWISSNDYFHNLATSMPVSEEYTLSQADHPSSQSRFIQPQAAQMCAVPPNWTSQTQTLWHQDPEDWTQLNHNVGILDTPRMD